MLSTTPTPESLIKARLALLGRSQNALARSIRRDPGHVSRVLRGINTSKIVLRRAEAWLAREEIKRSPAARRLPEPVATVAAR